MAWPPTLGAGATEAKEEEEGSRGGRWVGTRSQEAEARSGRPGAGSAGAGEGPHTALKCSSVTYLTGVQRKQKRLTGARETPSVGQDGGP